jgi:hypothetical protein
MRAGIDGFLEVREEVLLLLNIQVGFEYFNFISDRNFKPFILRHFWVRRKV